MSGENPREIAARVLGRRGGGEFIESVLDRELARARLGDADRRLCQELVYGLVRWQATLDWLIGRKAQKGAPPPGVQNLLRLGLYQVFWLDRIPDHAAVNETVELAKRTGFGRQAGFVNALLRGYLREFEATKQSLAELKTKEPALGYSHPPWLVGRWERQWGTAQTAMLMTWNNSPPATFARVNTLKTDAGKLLTQWRDEGVEYDFFRRDWVEESLVFEIKSCPQSLGDLRSFKQGLFYIQDPSTLLAVDELNPQPAEHVLDLCAAPGGKLSYIAQLMRNKGLLVGHDPEPARLKLIQENCARLAITCALAVSSLSSIPHSAPHTPHSFDRILVDAPCSNTGVMRRRIDLRWRIRAEDIQRLQRTQLELLRQAAELLKPGGTLVYSTCSLEPEENRGVVDQCLECTDLSLEKERQLTPFGDAVDGAYLVRFTA